MMSGRWFTGGKKEREQERENERTRRKRERERKRKSDRESDREGTQTESEGESERESEGKSTKERLSARVTSTLKGGGRLLKVKPQFFNEVCGTRRTKALQYSSGISNKICAQWVVSCSMALNCTRHAVASRRTMQLGDCCNSPEQVVTG